MKITTIKTTPVNVPLAIPFLWTAGYYPDTAKTIVEVETDEGIVGFGEAPSTDGFKSIEAMGEILPGMALTDVVSYGTFCCPPWHYIDVIKAGPFHQTDGQVCVPDCPRARRASRLGELQKRA